MLALTREQAVCSRVRDFKTLGEVLRVKEQWMEQYERLARSTCIENAIGCDAVGPDGRAQVELLVSEVLALFRQLHEIESGSQRYVLEELMDSKRGRRDLRTACIVMHAAKAYAASNDLGREGRCDARGIW